MNQCILTGNLGQDPDIRYSQNGDPIASFNLAFRLSKERTGLSDQNRKIQAKAKRPENNLRSFGISTGLSEIISLSGQIKKGHLATSGYPLVYRACISVQNTPI